MTENMLDQFNLSRRERQIADMLMGGTRVVKIADELQISPHTVRNHLKSCFRKMGVTSQVELITKFSSGTLVPDVPPTTLRTIVERFDEITQETNERLQRIEESVDRLVTILEEAASIRASVGTEEQANICTAG